MQKQLEKEEAEKGAAGDHRKVDQRAPEVIGGVGSLYKNFELPGGSYSFEVKYAG